MLHISDGGERSKPKNGVREGIEKSEDGAG